MAILVDMGFKASNIRFVPVSAFSGENVSTLSTGGPLSAWSPPPWPLRTAYCLALLTKYACYDAGTMGPRSWRPLMPFRPRSDQF